VADQYLFLTDAVSPSQLAAQLPARSVGVVVDGRALQCERDGRRRPERVQVGAEVQHLFGPQSQLPEFRRVSPAVNVFQLVEYHARSGRHHPRTLGNSATPTITTRPTPVTVYNSRTVRPISAASGSRCMAPSR